MRRYRNLSLKLVIGLAVASALAGPAARADVLYTLTSTGVITSGNDNGIFGGSGSLVGQSYTMVQTFDATLSLFTSGPATQQLSGPAVGNAVTTINGNSYTTIPGSSPFTLYSLTNYLHLSGNNGSNYDQVYGQVGSSGNYVDSFFYSTIVDFLNSVDLAQQFSYTLPLTGIDLARTDFTAGTTSFSGTITSVTLNGGTAPVPEPSTLILFSAGLAGLRWVRLRRGA